MVCWASNHFSANTLEKETFAIIIGFTALHNNLDWNLAVVYGPCR
jgi:hypothetical protein